MVYKSGSESDEMVGRKYRGKSKTGDIIGGGKHVERKSEGRRKLSKNAAGIGFC